jgi:hypothetical protein
METLWRTWLFILFLITLFKNLVKSCGLRFYKAVSESSIWSFLQLVPFIWKSSIFMDTCSSPFFNYIINLFMSVKFSMQIMCLSLRISDWFFPLQATKIGKAVNALRGHRSKQISQIAGTLVEYGSGAYSYWVFTVIVILTDLKLI